MKIIHVCNIENTANGIYSVLKSLVPAQIKYGAEIQIINTFKDGIQDSSFPYYNNNRFKKLIISSNPDLVVFHGVFYKSIIIFSKFLLQQNIPYIIEMHGALSQQNMKKNFWKKWFTRKLILNKVIRKASSIIYLNNQEYCNSTATDYNNRSIIIPNGCDGIDEISNPMNDTPEIVFIGRIDIHHKGLDYLIQALKLTTSNSFSVTAHFSLYGTGNQREIDWLNKNLKDISDIVDYKGPVYGEDKYNILRNADLMILTSRYEGFPMGILEALSHGVPVIVTPYTNVADIIETATAGWVTPLSPEDIANTINIAVTNYKKDPAYYRSNALFLSHRFNWNTIAAKSLSAYRNCIEFNI